MAVLRKILGVFLLLLALYIGWAYLMTLGVILNDLSGKTGPGKIGGVLATILFGLIMAALLYFMIRKGFRLLKKRKSVNEIDQIGQ